jgi:hypothetical protein
VEFRQPLSENRAVAHVLGDEVVTPLVVLLAASVDRARALFETVRVLGMSRLIM